jgi:hypothetical protein
MLVHVLMNGQQFHRASLVQNGNNRFSSDLF